MFGASVLAPVKSGGHREFYLLLVSEVIDHDAQIANMYINQVIGLLRGHELIDWGRVKMLWLVADCGPHFRSYENAAHFLFTIVKSLHLKVHVHYLGEQHGKGACDRLFGWTNKWLQKFLQKKPIHGINNLIEAYRLGGQDMMRDDPTGPVFVIHLFNPGPTRPSMRKSLSCGDFKITYTYSLSGEESAYASTGIILRNHVFSDLTAKDSLSNWSITESVSKEKLDWRIGYYDKPKSWETVGPQVGDENAITRKFSSQKELKSNSMPTPKRTLEEKMSAKARTLSKQARKRQKLKHSLSQSAHPSASASSGSSSSSSSSSSEPEENAA